MPATLVTAIVDAIMADLLALNLANFKTIRKYAPPLDYLPAQLPGLYVWSPTTEYRILSGARGLCAYERVHTITIAWVVWDPKGAEMGGAGDPAVVQALEQAVAPLVDRLVTYASGVPGLSPELVASLTSKTTEVSESGAWEAVITMTVEEAA